MTFFNVKVSYLHTLNDLQISLKNYSNKSAILLA